MSSAISSASDGGKSLRPTSVARATFSFNAAWVFTMARTTADAVWGERSINCPVAAPHVEHHGADSAAYRDLGTHAVGPEAVDLALLQRLRRGDAEIHAGALRARHRRDLHLIAREVDAGFDQQAAQPHVDPRRRADAASLHDAKIATLAAEILVHDQEPVHALALRAQKLGALPARKRRQRRMRRSADEIDRAVTQRRVALVDGVDQLERDIEPFPLEATELDRSDRGEVRVRDHVGHGEFHVSNSGFLKAS